MLVLFVATSNVSTQSRPISIIPSWVERGEDGVVDGAGEVGPARGSGHTRGGDNTPKFQQVNGHRLSIIVGRLKSMCASIIVIVSFKD